MLKGYIEYWTARMTRGIYRDVNLSAPSEIDMKIDIRRIYRGAFMSGLAWFYSRLIPWRGQF